MLLDTETLEKDVDNDPHGSVADALGLDACATAPPNTVVVDATSAGGGASNPPFDPGGASLGTIPLPTGLSFLGAYS